jgi:integrase
MSPPIPISVRRRHATAFLSEAELEAIWKACGDDDFGRSIKLLILTGQREAEISQLLWDDVHDDEIILTPDRVKNKRAHVIPLSSPAREIIGPRSILRSHVFGRSDTGFKGHGNAKARFDKQLDIPAWRIHDIRRSVATHMAEQLGIQPHVIEAVLNHVSGYKAGVAGIYNRASYRQGETPSARPVGRALHDHGRGTRLDCRADDAGVTCPLTKP